MSRSGRWVCVPLLLAIPCARVVSQPVIPFFGIQTHFGQSRPGADSAMDRIRTAGIKAIRDEVYWHDVETDSGVFTFQAKHDSYVDAALARGIRPLIILDYGHPLYGGTPRDSSSRAAFARYCSTVVARYAPRGVMEYEVWNEPNLCIPEFCPWSPAPDPVEYVALLKEAYAACKRADPAVTVLAGATSPLDEPETSQKIPGVSFIDRIMRLGAGDHCDAISFHQYPVGRAPEEWLPAEVARMRAVAPGRRFWITEAGHHTSTAYGGIAENVHAQWLIRAILIGRGIADLDRLSWYDLQDDCSDEANPECRYGILRQDGSPKEAFRALVALHSVIGERTFAGVVERDGGFEAVFGGGDSVVRVLWTRSGSATLSVGVPTAYATVLSLVGDEPRIVGTSGGTITVVATERPLYVRAMPEGPTLRGLRVNPGSCILDSSQSVLFEVSGWTGDSLTIPLDPASVTWAFQGSCVQVSPGGIVSAVTVGEGTLLAVSGDLRDSVHIRVVSPSGAYLLEGFGSDGWALRTELMDTTATRIVLPDTSGGLTLRYRLVYAQANANKYLTRLSPPAPVAIPGRADSVKLFVRGDGQNHAILFQIADRDGELFPTIPRRVTWNDAWRPVASRVNPGSGRFDLPADVREVYLYLVPAVAPAEGSIVEGVLQFDSLLALFNPRPAASNHSSPPQEPPFALPVNFPNPFNPATHVRFSIRESGFVRLEVFDLVGRSVAVLVDRALEAGEHTVPWTCAACPSGVYVCRIMAGGLSASRLLVLAR